MTAAEYQLSLFKGKRQRGVRAPSATEFQLHCSIADAIRATKLSPGWGWMHPANGEHRNPITGARLQRMGVQPGAPDLLLWGPPHATLHGLELKRRGQKPTTGQYDFGQQIIHAGGQWAWVDSYDGAIAQLRAWGALPTMIGGRA